MQICKLQKIQITKALDLCREVFDEFDACDYSETGIQTFYYFIREENIREMIDAGNMKVYGAFEKSELVGVLALRKPSHVSLLFVKKEFHHQGIAKKLMEMAKATIKNGNSGLSCLTVNAAPYAVGAYQKMGFVKTSDEQEKDGIRFTTMVCQVV